MRRTVAVAAVMVMALAPLSWMGEAWARSGDGYSGGSRGSRTASPAKPSVGKGSSSYSSPWSSSPARPAPQRSGWGRMLRGLLLGGLIGSLLLGRKSLGGIGVLEIMMLAGFIYLAFRHLNDRRPEAAASPGYASAGVEGAGDGHFPDGIPTGQSPATLDELNRGIGFIRQTDPDFDLARFGGTARDVFSKVQAAWTTRDVGRAADVLSPEMQAVFQEDCDRMRAEHRINRLESVAVRRAQITEAWQERGRDYVTVRFQGTVIDYTTDEPGTQVLDGHPVEPVTFEDFWTFARPVGPHPWKLSAIQQPVTG